MEFNNFIENRLSRGEKWVENGKEYRIRNLVKYAKVFGNGGVKQYDIELILVDPKEVDDNNCKEVHLIYSRHNLDSEFESLFKQNIHQYEEDTKDH